MRVPTTLVGVLFILLGLGSAASDPVLHTTASINASQWHSSARSSGIDPDGRTSGIDPDGRSSGIDPDGRSSGIDPDGRSSGIDPDGKASAATWSRRFDTESSC